MTDRTFDEASAVGSVRWAATRLGWSPSTFRERRDQLEAAGFPRPDPLLGRYLKADVDAWLARRRVSAERVDLLGDDRGVDLGAI